MMTKHSSPRAVNVEDLRSLSRRRLPKVIFDYIDGGAEAEITLRENLRAFEEVRFCPRQAVANPECDLRVQVLGRDLSIPVLLAPVGYCRVMHPGGEVAVARAAGAAGTAYILSTEIAFMLWLSIKGAKPPALAPAVA
jgi:L-lactate dehydrogenase (cytochrome)